MSKAAEVFPVSYFIAEEMNARGWSKDDLLNRMPGIRALNDIWLELIFAAPDMELELRQNMTIGDAGPLAHAFGTSKELWENLDATWVAYQRTITK